MRAHCVLSMQRVSTTVRKKSGQRSSAKSVSPFAVGSAEAVAGGDTVVDAIVVKAAQEFDIRSAFTLGALGGSDPGDVHPLPRKRPRGRDSDAECERRGSSGEAAALGAAKDFVDLTSPVPCSIVGFAGNVLFPAKSAEHEPLSARLGSSGVSVDKVAYAESLGNIRNSWLAGAVRTCESSRTVDLSRAISSPNPESRPHLAEGVNSRSGGCSNGTAGSGAGSRTKLESVGLYAGHPEKDLWRKSRNGDSAKPSHEQQTDASPIREDSLRNKRWMSPLSAALLTGASSGRKKRKKKFFKGKKGMREGKLHAPETGEFDKLVRTGTIGSHLREEERKNLGRPLLEPGRSHQARGGKGKRLGDAGRRRVIDPIAASMGQLEEDRDLNCVETLSINATVDDPVGDEDDLDLKISCETGGKQASQSGPDVPNEDLEDECDDIDHIRPGRSVLPVIPKRRKRVLPPSSTACRVPVVASAMQEGGVHAGASPGKKSSWLNDEDIDVAMGEERSNWSSLQRPNGDGFASGRERGPPVDLKSNTPSFSAKTKQSICAEDCAGRTAAMFPACDKSVSRKELLSSPVIGRLVSCDAQPEVPSFRQTRSPLSANSVPQVHPRTSATRGDTARKSLRLRSRKSLGGLEDIIDLTGDDDEERSCMSACSLPQDGKCSMTAVGSITGVDSVSDVVGFQNGKLVPHADGPVDQAFIDPPKLRDLTDAEKALFDALTRGRRNHDCEKLATIACANITLCRADFKRLRNVRWLNDELINAYVALINERNRLHFARCPARGRGMTRPRTFVFNTYFHTRLSAAGYDYPGVARWTRRAQVNVLELDLILVPVNLGNNHWVLSGIDLEFESFLYLDSMHGADRSGVTQTLRRWLYDEVVDKHGIAAANKLEVDVWALLTNAYLPYNQTSCRGARSARKSSIPRQRDSGSCGVFTAKFADCLERGEEIYFDHSHIRLIRQRMALDLYRRHLPG